MQEKCYRIDGKMEEEGGNKRLKLEIMSANLGNLGKDVEKLKKSSKLYEERFDFQFKKDRNILESIQTKCMSMEKEIAKISEKVEDMEVDLSNLWDMMNWIIQGMKAC